MDILKIREAISNKDEPLLRELMVEYNLEIRDGKLFPKDQKSNYDHQMFWHQRQEARKILLNVSI